MTTEITTSTEADQTPDENRWELVRLVQVAVRRWRWGVRLLVVGSMILLAAQVASVFRMFHDIHPWAGVAASLVFVALVGWFVFRPLVLLWRVPSAVTPPLIPDEMVQTLEHGRKQLAYLRRYVAMLERNPELPNDPQQFVDARGALDELDRRMDDVPESTEWHARITEVEEKHILPLLKPLDRKADALIRKEALAIGTMTAISHMGTVDAFLVLWRDVNLVASISRLYYGRPGLHGTALIVRDVASAILLSSVLERVSQIGSGVVRKMGEGGRHIPLLGAMVGPLLDGTVNALMTMKVGYLAKERCRSFQAWDRSMTQNVLHRTFLKVSNSATGLVEEINLALGTTLGRVGAGAKASVHASREVLTGASNLTVQLLRGIRSGLFGRTVPPAD